MTWRTAWNALQALGCCAVKMPSRIKAVGMRGLPFQKGVWIYMGVSLLKLVPLKHLLSVAHSPEPKCGLLYRLCFDSTLKNRFAGLAKNDAGNPPTLRRDVDRQGWRFVCWYPIREHPHEARDFGRSWASLPAEPLVVRQNIQTLIVRVHVLHPPSCVSKGPTLMELMDLPCFFLLPKPSGSM